MLRVVAGRFRGRRLQTPDVPTVRPTADRMKESLFNVLQGQVEGARVLDLYAGGGNLGIEAVSRGAAHVVLVERDAAVVRCLRRNLASLELTDSPAVAVVQADAIRYLRQTRAAPFGVILADPPYDSACEDALLAAVEPRHLAPRGLFVLQHRRSWTLQEVPAGLQHVKSRRFGDTTIDFLQRLGDADG